VKSTKVASKITTVHFKNVSKQVKTMLKSRDSLRQEWRNAALTLSHDKLSDSFSMPLSTILILLDRLQSELETEAQKHTVSIVYGQILLMLCLVNDVLDLKMIAGGHFKP